MLNTWSKALQRFDSYYVLINLKATRWIIVQSHKDLLDLGLVGFFMVRYCYAETSLNKVT